MRANRLRRLLERTTPGMWSVVTGHKTVAVRAHDAGCYVFGNIDLVGVVEDTVERWKNDAQFIVAARDSLPSLLDENERLRAAMEELLEEREQLRAENERLRDSCSLGLAGEPQ